MKLNFSANLSMLYKDVPFLDRFSRASQSGFGAVEFLFPYDAGIDAVKTRLDDHGLTLVLFNMHAGDREAGEWGTLSNPNRKDYFKWSCNITLEAAVSLKCGQIHAMFGQKVEGISMKSQIDCACENLNWAASLAKDAGVDLLLEALNPIDFPNYALPFTDRALAVIRRVNHPNVMLQYDVYHAQMTRGNLINSIAKHFEYIRHIQIADVPGRHQPGSGEINYPSIFAALGRMKYTRFIGLEYQPEGDTDESLGWLPVMERGYAGND